MPAPETLPRTPEGAIDWPEMLRQHEAYCAGSRTIQRIDAMAAELREHAPLRRVMIAAACEGWMKP